MAEAIFRHLAAREGLEIIVDSCGTAGYHIGKPPHEGTRKILNSHGISYAGIKASQLERQHLTQFDGIVAMDNENLSDILRLKNKNSTAWVKLLSDFSDGTWADVPDPYYTGNFELTYKLITEGCEGLLIYLSSV
jgi:protein-tyrosine phosphatase